MHIVNGLIVYGLHFVPICLPAAVVWNPWEKKSKAMVDIGDEEYKQMVCVDGAAIEKPVTLKPGEEWTGRLQLSVVPSSFCSEHLNL
jgi:glucose-6-phosphate 1-epimerase